MKMDCVRAALCAAVVSSLHGASLFAQTAPAAIVVNISGVPPTSVVAGESYDFTPNAIAVGPLAAHFTMFNMPSWATLDFSGRLHGTPTEADVGVYSNIVMSFSEGQVMASLPAFSITVVSASPSVSQPGQPSQPPTASPVSATLSWMPPTENSDGSVLTDLASYRVYIGSSPTSLQPLVVISNPGLARYVIDGLAPGHYYFAMTAVDARGVESALSQVVDATLD